MKVRSCLRLPINSDGAAYNNLPTNTPYFYSLDCVEKIIQQIEKKYDVVQRLDYRDFIQIEVEIDI